ncbi:MAG: hypothetical protein QW273_02950 [Candidatus Pacearchaeota archaeon]
MRKNLAKIISMGAIAGALFASELGAKDKSHTLNNPYSGTNKVVTSNYEVKKDYSSKTNQIEDLRKNLIETLNKIDEFRNELYNVVNPLLGSELGTKDKASALNNYSSKTNNVVTSNYEPKVDYSSKTNQIEELRDKNELTCISVEESYQRKITFIGPSSNPYTTNLLNNLSSETNKVVVPTHKSKEKDHKKKNNMKDHSSKTNQIEDLRDNIEGTFTRSEEFYQRNITSIGPFSSSYGANFSNVLGEFSSFLRKGLKDLGSAIDQSKQEFRKTLDQAREAFSSSTNFFSPEEMELYNKTFKK